MSVVVTYNRDGSTSYFDDGVEISAEEHRRRYPPRGIEAGKAPRGHHSACWPMKSDQLGINPENRAVASENLRRMGIPTEFNEKGQAILTSRGHRKRLAEHIGARDRSPKASWGDP